MSINKKEGGGDALRKREDPDIIRGRSAATGGGDRAGGKNNVFAPKSERRGDRGIIFKPTGGRSA